jgi:hypothetical protein
MSAPVIWVSSLKKKRPPPLGGGLACLLGLRYALGQPRPFVPGNKAEADKKERNAYEEVVAGHERADVRGSSAARLVVEPQMLAAALVE